MLVGLTVAPQVGLGTHEGAALEQRPFPAVSKGELLALGQGMFTETHQLPCWHAEPLMHLYSRTCKVKSSAAASTCADSTVILSVAPDQTAIKQLTVISYRHGRL